MHSSTSHYYIHLAFLSPIQYYIYNMEDDREMRVDEAMIAEGNGDRERREFWRPSGGAGVGGGGGCSRRMMV